MGVADLRNAFNDIAEMAGYSCSQALMDVEHGADGEMHIVTFIGNGPNGPFRVRSAPIAADSDMAEACKRTAQTLVNS